MKRNRQRRQGPSALDLIEHATHLVRTTPAATLALYYVGAIPFVLGFLYFWTDMSRSPFAHQHLAEASLATTALFLWMKFCQALFARRLRAQVARRPMPSAKLSVYARIFLEQAVVQPTGLFLVPLSLIPAVFGWVFAFYQNVTVLPDSDGTRAGGRWKQAWKMAALWPTQNHKILLIVFTFAFCVFLNVSILCLILPNLVKTLLGAETVFSRSPISMFNTTFFMAMVGLTYLCVDPIVKAVYALRCFHGESLHTGEDLKAELKQFARDYSRPSAMAATLLALLLLVPLRGTAEDAGVRPSSSPSGVPAQTQPAGRDTVSPPDLDRAISEVVREQKYTWRTPREKNAAPETEQGPIGRFLQKVSDMVRDGLKAVGEWIGKLINKLFKGRSSGGSSGSSWIVTENLLLYLLIAVAIVALFMLMYRVWRKNQRSQPAVVSEAIQPEPDLADEDLGADQLPEDGWTALARQLLERGELRLALRAFYLATLAHLAQRNLISIARFKSNRDYERELNRRGHSLPALQSVFAENVAVFERTWYGMHDVNRERVDRFAANVERIRTTA